MLYGLLRASRFGKVVQIRQIEALKALADIPGGNPGFAVFPAFPAEHPGQRLRSGPAPGDDGRLRSLGKLNVRIGQSRYEGGRAVGCRPGRQHIRVERARRHSGAFGAVALFRTDGDGTLTVKDPGIDQ